MTKTILITGGLGFIGTNVIRRLLVTTNHRVLIFDKSVSKKRLKNLPSDFLTSKRVKIVEGDITNKQDINRSLKQASIIIHMAAQTHAHRSLAQATETVITNVVGTTLLLEAIEQYPVERFILLSSSEVYGNQKKGIPMDENHPLVPVTPYAASKLAADRLAYSFYLTKKLPITILRPFNAYGPYQQTDKMIPLFITRLINNLPITLNQGGKPKRDWVHVEDHARAIEMVVKAPQKKIKGEIFNLGTGKAISNKKVAKLILKTLGKDTSLVKIAPPSRSAPETMGNVGISKKAKKILGWKANTPLDEGLNKTVMWYKENRWWWKGNH